MRRHLSLDLNRHTSPLGMMASSVPAMAGSDAAEPGEHIDGPQGKLRIHRSGSGPRILFLHADAGRSAQWREVIGLVSTEFETCAVDFRGHGASDPAANGDYSFLGRAKDALAVVNELDWDQFLVVSHSGGCAAALALAAEQPERVRGMLLVDPATDPRVIPKEVMADMLSGLSGPDSLSYLKRYYTSIAGPDQTVQSRVLADAEATTAASRSGVGNALAEWKPEAALDGYKGPMLILGTDISDGANALYALRPNIPHRVVHGTGHWLQIEHPMMVADAIRELAKNAPQ